MVVVVDVPVLVVPALEVEVVLEVVDVEVDPVVAAVAAALPSTGTPPPHPTVTQAAIIRPPKARAIDNCAAARIQSPFCFVAGTVCGAVGPGQSVGI